MNAAKKNTLDDNKKIVVLLAEKVSTAIEAKDAAGRVYIEAFEESFKDRRTEIDPFNREFVHHSVVYDCLYELLRKLNSADVETDVFLDIVQDYVNSLFRRYGAETQYAARAAYIIVGNELVDLMKSIR